MYEGKHPEEEEDSVTECCDYSQVCSLIAIAVGLALWFCDQGLFPGDLGSRLSRVTALSS